MSRPDNVAVVWLDGKLAALSVVRPLDVAVPFRVGISLDARPVTSTLTQDAEAMMARWHLRNAAERGMVK